MGVYTARVWAPTIGHLCLFLEGVSLETWRHLVIGWLVTARSLLWRVFFFFFLLPFQLNVEYGTLKGHSECVKICVCLFSPPASFFFSFLYQFYTEILGWDLRPTFILSFTLSWPFKIREVYKKIIIIQCQKSHVGNNPRESSASFPRAPVEGRTPNVCILKRKCEVYKPRNRSEIAHISTCTLMWQCGNEIIWT